MANELRWWQQGLIYQVLVPSFQDSNGDGLGDLPGVLERLDHIHWMGAKAIWLSPIFPSPMMDLGYDVTDYTDVNPRFGTLDDFDRLLAAVHERDMKLILDWVASHTSSEHAWFAAASSSRDDPQRDWYLWRDPEPDGSPPNNWISVFGGSVWQWHEPSGQYYFHTFLEQQPDLNWRNPAVQEAIADAMRFWLERGVEGFRLDAACLMIKAEQFRDNPPNPDYNPEKDGPDNQLLPKYTRDQPYVHEVLAKLRAVVDEFPDRLLAGELYLPFEKIVTYYGREQPELHLPLNMHLAWIDWEADKLVRAVDEYLKICPADACPTWIISTHDCPRFARRAEGEQTRNAALLLATLPGAATIYYGEEIGMLGADIPAEEAQDPQGLRTGRNRDPERTPMQWEDRLQAGFTTGEPWLRTGDDLPHANVAVQAEDEHSLLTLYRRLLHLRRQEPGLATGRLEFVSREAPVIAYRRQSEHGNFLIVINFGFETQSYELQEQGLRLLLNTFLDRAEEPVAGRVELRPAEGLILAIES